MAGTGTSVTCLILSDLHRLTRLQGQGARHKMKIMQIPVVYRCRVLYTALRRVRRSSVREAELQSETAADHREFIDVNRWDRVDDSDEDISVFIRKDLKFLMN